MKKAAIVLGVLLLVAAGAVLLAYHSLDFIARAAIEHYGPRVAGVPLTVAEATVSAREGRAVVKGVEIGNPPGFSSPRAARLGEIRVGLDPLTLTDPVIFVHELAVIAPLITYERGDAGANLDAIRKNIEGHVARSGAASQGRETAAAARVGRKLIIARLVVRGGRVTVTNRALKGQGLSFDLPDIELRDVGKRQGGVTPAEVAALVAAVIQQKIAQKALTNLDLLRHGGVEGAVDALRGLLPR
jgi:uncharacterized protein involved in outer membrane biogenesis